MNHNNHNPTQNKTHDKVIRRDDPAQNNPYVRLRVSIEEAQVHACYRWLHISLETAKLNRGSRQTYMDEAAVRSHHLGKHLLELRKLVPAWNWEEYVQQKLPLSREECEKFMAFAKESLYVGYKVVDYPWQQGD